MALKRKGSCKALFNNFYDLFSYAMFHYRTLVLLSVIIILSTSYFLLTNYPTSCTELYRNSGLALPDELTSIYS